ncbi:type VI secretion system membrane subunit TssM, partial [Inquilinus sp.]|uniref:type VI secretion system membrane subunit TssM n=1 Tax=Inquilinus sp. TaxID=1932117 RepID=UPI0031D2C970
MRKILSILTARWFVTLIGVLLLAAIVWFVGPLFAFDTVRPLESELVRVAVIAALLVIWAFAIAWSIVRSRNANARLVDDMAQEAASPGEAAEEEIETIRGRLTEALAVLKNTRLGKKGGRRWLYELPWYILIGPPGAGKTTALVNSGIDFPLAERTGQGRDAIRGIGGTRNCDWWFTNEAVLIDTAGRYTTQDSHAARDAAAWKGFLGLLKRNRPRQPINGALICVSISDLAIMPEAERTAHARAVRQRLQELSDELGVRFPVYVLFTKADLLAGFSEFFDDLDREAREQVWGISFAFDEGKGEQGAVAGFLKEFDRLVDRLNERVITRLHQEPDIRNRSLIYGFPAQVASLREPLHEFLTEAFRPSRYDARPLLRGAYLTSGTQEGTPFDRLMGAMAQSFGLDRQQMAPPQGRGRSYFLTDLLRRVVFAEAHIVSTNPKVERRLRWVRWGATTAALLVLAGGLSAWTVSYLGNRDLIASVQSGLNDYGAKLGDAVGPVRNADLASVLPALDLLRAMPTGYDRRNDEVPVTMQFGLYQGDVLSQGTVPAYRRALNTLLLPRLVVRLEDILRQVKAPSNLAYVALKSYLMLGGRAPDIDRDTILAWLKVDLEQRYPGADDAPHRQAILDHTAALLERPITVVGIDGKLVDQARRVLGATPPAESAYRMMLDDPAVKALPDWTITANGGPGAERVLIRPSGKRLSEGVPGAYTYRAFHEMVLAGIERAARAVASERWVVDSQAPPGDADDATIARIGGDALQLYYNDYVSAWNALLADVQIVPFQSRDHAIDTLETLSAPGSPLVAVLRGAAKETDLAAPPPAPAAGAGGLTTGQKAAADLAAGEVQNAAQQALGTGGRLATLVAEDYAKTRLGGGATAADAPPPGAYVSDRFRDLRDFVNGPNG